MYNCLNKTADDEFYSPANDTLTGIEGKTKATTSLDSLKKTGLGSSAALTVSLVAALLVHYLNLSLYDPADLDIIERMAHASHYLAQGSLGSGFDIRFGRLTIGLLGTDDW